MSGLAIRKALPGDVPAVQAIAREVILTGFRAFLGDAAVTAFVAGGQSDREFVEHRENLHVLADGQRVVKLIYERLVARPDRLYGSAIGSSYQRQGLKLSKHFKPL